MVERGAYLTRVGDCISCHTAPGGKPFAGGLPMNTGFGILYTPNITPDKETGIGGWSDQAFYSAMHAGRDDEGKHLYPAFPYPWFTKVTQADVQAIRAYLNTLEPVKQTHKPNQMAWYIRWRELIAGWNLINFDKGEYKPNTAKSAEWNRGAYLVQGLGHCGECHTAKKTFGGAEKSIALEGGLADDWYAPTLGRDLRSGLGRWSVADIVEYLKTGSNARTAPAGPMSQVITNSTSHMTDADLTAVAIYLKDSPTPPRPEPKVAPLTNQALVRGQALFIDQCIGCHMYDGGGLRNVFPTLQSSSAIQARDPATVVRVVLEGAHIPSTPAKPTGIAMPAFGWKLDDAQVADVVNYIRNAWGNQASLVSAETVAKARKGLNNSNSAAR